MALTKNKTYVDITVDGRQFGYNVAQSEVDLWVKAEKLINDEINTFRKPHKKESNVTDTNYRADSLIVVLIKVVIELVSCRQALLFAKINSYLMLPSHSADNDRPGLPLGGFRLRDVGSQSLNRSSNLKIIKIFHKTALLDGFFLCSFSLVHSAVYCFVAQAATKYYIYKWNKLTS